ncbi:MAG TPA: DUF1127 domain-containing protein [Thermohalobaculum sp.]|nr:DUF1127 domain-containing protein [Thermohalobaculum sp.]
MTITSMTAPVAPFGAITAHRIVTGFESALAALREWNETRRTIAILRALNADQLEDIGLSRADVEAMGHKGF